MFDVIRYRRGSFDDIEGTMRAFIRAYERKLHDGVLPPDPARVAKQVLEKFAEVEHAVPVPPIIEKLHRDVGIPAVESLPRLPLTRDFGTY